MNRAELISWLEEKDPSRVNSLFSEAFRLRKLYLGNKVYLRGLIELSNICIKNCLYCGLRRDNNLVSRYELSAEQVTEAALFAWKSRYGSVVLQAGERSSAEYTSFVTELLKSIYKATSGELGITLSLGEQSKETYKEWLRAGAHRYLLRIESSNPEIYSRIHPPGALHSYRKRLQALRDLKECGFQTGTGVMIGLPGQTTADLADDLLFIVREGVHMVGMGPYLTHSQTPMGAEDRGQKELSLSLKMVALLRILKPKINIAATTALQVIDPGGREQAVFCGANVIMPNITLNEVRADYQIYENKPGIADDAAISKSKLEQTLAAAGIEIGWEERGDPQEYWDRLNAKADSR